MMIKVLGISFMLFSMNYASRAQAHGEDKPGPHQGFIRMPGAFHTEVKDEGPRGFKIYLLDVSLKNPSVDDSLVEATVSAKDGRSIALACKVEGKAFICQGPEGLKKESLSALSIKAKRKGVQGGVAQYPLPLRVLGQHESVSR